MAAFKSRVKRKEIPKERQIEQDALLSLRVTGSHRIYGYMEQAVFHILWIDLDHGDNDNCVYRAPKKIHDITRGLSHSWLVIQWSDGSLFVCKKHSKNKESLEISTTPRDLVV